MKTLAFLFAMVLGISAVNAQTRSAVKLTDLPKSITDNIATQHQGWNAVEAFKVDTKGVTTYEVLVKKGSSESNLIYDNNGNYLKMAPHKMASASSSKSTGSTPSKTMTKKKTK